MSRENRLLLILFLSFGFVFFDRQALAFLAPQIGRDFPLSNTELGLLSGVLALTWALSGMFAGRISDRLGIRKPILVTAVVLFSVFSAMSGLMTGFAGLLVARALMGIAEGAVLPVAQSLMMDASSTHRRGLNMGLVQGSSAGLLGGIACPLVVVPLAEAYGWRTAFYVTIVPGLLLAVWIAKSVRDRPAAPRPVPEVPRKPVKSRENVTEKVTLRQILAHRNVLLCMLAACCYLTWFVVIITFTPSYLTTVKGFSSGTMSAVMTCFGVAWVLWGFLTPAISDRIGRRRSMIWFSAIAAACPVLVVFVENPVLLGVLVILTYTGLGCFTLFMATIPAETVPPSALAGTLGLVMGVGELAGGVFGPIIAGRASDAWGLSAAMFIAAGGALLVALLSCWLKETAPMLHLRKGRTPIAEAAG
ncbi:MFS transporter [Amycolatopsis nigrescens]|uniref:MFS transporter n=1 Tax=Amycolatopsis nigrescens TaxID=381445 RepID=UPI000366837C|nr:MFS transporter [Amycolatopsis nigrescens]